MTRAFDLDDAIVCTLEYVGRYFVAGFAAIPVLVAVLKHEVAVAAVLFHNLLGVIFLFPGALLINFGLIRNLGPTRRPHTWWAALATVLATGAGYALIALVPVPPADMLRRLAGTEWAWAIHIGGWNVAASTLGLLWGWFARSLLEEGS